MPNVSVVANSTWKVSFYLDRWLFDHGTSAFRLVCLSHHMTHIDLIRHSHLAPFIPNLSSDAENKILVKPTNITVFACVRI